MIDSRESNAGKKEEEDGKEGTVGDKSRRRRKRILGRDATGSGVGKSNQSTDSPIYLYESCGIRYK